MSFRAISDSALIPSAIICVDVAQTISGPITFISLPAAALTQDIAKEMLDRIRHLKKSYTKSVGPNSNPPKAQAFSDAEAFVRKLPLTRTGTPRINVASDGEVNFDWASDGIRIDLGFFGNGTYSFYGRGNGTEIFGENIGLDADVPADLIGLATPA